VTSTSVDASAVAEAPPPVLVADGRIDAPEDRFRRRLGLAGLVIVIVSAAACIPLLGGWDLRSMNDLGLASVFPVAFWVALFGNALGTMLCILGRRWGFTAVALIVTVFLLPGLAVLVEPNIRFDVAWRHLGLIDEIATSRRVDPRIDAYFNWPGFFSLFAFLQQALGLANLYTVVKVAPILFNLAYLVPLYRIGITTTGSRLVTWAGMWLFCLFNWIGQDYFSPQALYFLFYLVVIALASSYFKRSADLNIVVKPPRLLPARLRSLRSRVPSPNLLVRAHDSRTRVGFALVVIVLAAWIVPSHQLSPFFLILALGALALFGLTTLSRTPLLLALVTVGWLAFAAVTYVQGHVDAVFGGLGHLESIFGKNVSARVAGSPGHQLIVRLRLASEILLWSTAALGLVRRVRAGLEWGWLAVLAVAPFLLLGVQSYGGEVLLRCALFASPFMSFLAASAFLKLGDRISVRGAAGLVAVSLLATALFPFVRWGNEKADWFSNQEIQAVQQMYAKAPRGSVLVGVSGSIPWRGQDYAAYDYRDLEGKNRTDVAKRRSPGPEQFVNLDTPDSELLISQITARMRPKQGQCAFLLATRAQAANMQLTGPFSAGALQHVIDTVKASNAFREVYVNRDAALFSLGTCTRPGGR
jgi:hypothetical protein